MTTPTMIDIYRILSAFDFIKNGGIYPHGCTEQQGKILDYDTKRIRDRYEELKWKTSFSEAMTTAKAEYMYWIFSGCPESARG